MLELLEHKMKSLRLEPHQMELLKDGLKTERFSKSASLVANQLRQKNKHEIADKLMDMSPLFDPHDFWHN